MKFVASIALAALVLVTAGPSYAQPLRSTSIPSSLADDEKRLMPEVMNEFYGTFDREKACWISKHEDDGHEDTYCMKPIRLDVRSSSGRRMLFIVAGGQKLEEGIPAEYHAATGVFGLIVLTPRGAHLGAVATNNLYEGFETYGRYPRPESVTIHRLGPNGAYGWVAELGDQHSNHDIRWARVYGVVGNSVKVLTEVTSYFSEDICGDDEARCSTLSVKYAFQTQSSASSFYPITLRVSGSYNGRPFRGNYILVFDKGSLRYLVPKNMPDEIKPVAQETKLSRRGSSSVPTHRGRVVVVPR
jgi:hypothetical protein